MSVRTVGLHTIGQTPRPDLTDRFSHRFPTVKFEVRGALDGISSAEAVPAPDPGGFPLETRLRDGTRVVFDEAFLEPNLQRSIHEMDPSVDVHVVLCAGSFAGLESRRVLIRPFHVVGQEMKLRGWRSIEAVVPFEKQSAPAIRKWESAGFQCRAHPLAGRPDSAELRNWLARRLRGSDADGVLVDYVGMKPEVMNDIQEASPLSVIDMDESVMVALTRSTETFMGTGR